MRMDQRAIVLTQDESRMRRVGEQINAGTVWVRTLASKTACNAISGGMKSLGTEP